MIPTILDIKTGSVQPWTAIQLAAYSMLDTPVEFDEESHTYRYEGVKLPSVTGILKAEGFIDARFYDEFSRQRGTAAHLACHYDDLGILDESTIDPVILPYLSAWRKFRAESGFVVTVSEAPLMSAAYRFAGKPDAIGTFPSGRIQRAAVELHNNGTYRLIPYTDRQDAKIFLAALACHNWKLNHGGRE
ncbi:MAG: hypothetical protein WC343_13290 [Bacilli bacterium]